MRNLIIHVGTHKTGSTSLQSFLWENRERLAANGVLYPSAGRGNGKQHHALARLIKQQPTPFRFEQLKQEVEGSDAETVLVSSEMLAACDPARVKEVLAPLGRIARAVIYLRRQDEYLLASYSQFVKQNPGRFKGDINAARARVEALNISDYHALVRRWREALGEGVMDVHVYAKSDDDLFLYRDFLGAVGFELTEDWVIPKARVNPSLGLDSIETIRHCNKMSLSAKEHGQLVLALMAIDRRLGTAYNRSKTSWLSEDERMALMDRYASSNARLAEELGREDGQLFPPVAGDSNTERYDGLNVERLTRVFGLLITRGNLEQRRLRKKIRGLEDQAEEALRSNRQLKKSLTAHKRLLQDLQRSAERLADLERKVDQLHRSGGG